MSRVWRTSAIQYRKKILSARHVLLYNLPSLWSANSSCKRASQDIYMFLFGRHVYHDSNVFVLVLRSMGFHSSLTFRSSICYSDGYYRCYFNYTKYKIFKLIKASGSSSRVRIYLGYWPLICWSEASSRFRVASSLTVAAVSWTYLRCLPHTPWMTKEGKHTLLPEFTMLSLS